MNQTTAKFEMLLAPRRLFFRVLMVIFLAELAVHFLLFRVQRLIPGSFPNELLDSMTLSLMLAPFLWWWIIRPLGSAAMHEKMLAANVINTSVDSIITIDDRGRITAFNPAAERLFGYAKQEAIGQNVKMLMPPAERKQHDAHIGLYLRTGEKKVIGLGRELVAQRKDGATFPIYLSLSEAREGDRPIFTGIARDLTDRKQTEKEQARLTAILQATTDMVATADLKGFVQYINHAGRKMLGLGEDQDVTNTRIVDYHAEWAASIVANVGIPAAIESGFWSGETALLSRDGREIPLSQVIIAHTAPDGTIEYLSTIGRDITERKRAEERLAAQYVVTRALADSVTLAEATPKILRAICETLGWVWGALWIVDGEANVLRCQEVWDDPSAKMSQFETASRELTFAPSVGLPGCVWADERPIWMADVLQDERFFRGPITAKLNLHGALAVPILSGSSVVGVMEFFSKLIREPDSELLAMMATVSSQIAVAIERKQAEKALRESEGRYRDLVENAHDIIYSHDLDGNYTSINKAGEQITGYTREDVLKLNLLQTIAPEHLAKAREMLSKKLSGEKVTVFEMEILAKDGRRIAVEANTKLVLHDGVPVGVQGIARDITERKRLEEALRESEEQLRQSQKLEAIGQLAGGVAHDFNNLLTVISGYSELLLRRLPEESPFRASAEEIKKAGELAAGLTRQLLAFSRKQILQPKVLDLNSVVSELEKMLRRLIGEDIDLLTITEPALGQVKADPGQIEQVILNLAVNARDAMPNGGQLTIQTSNACMSEDYAQHHVSAVAGNYVMLAVSDNGCGMDMDTKERIFEPFFTTKGAGKGTGLGLSTVYGIVKQSGGNIWVYSEAGKGTAFKIYLPRVDEPRDVGFAHGGSTPAPHGTETILLVEDEEQVRRIVHEILETQGYQVLVAVNGEEALAIAQQHEGEIDLMITDVVMPQMGGRESVERLSPLRPRMRVLYMSGYTDDAIVRHGLIDEQLQFIGKPFTADALARKVRTVLDSGAEMIA